MSFAYFQNLVRFTDWVIILPPQNRQSDIKVNTDFQKTVPGSETDGVYSAGTKAKLSIYLQIFRLRLEDSSEKSYLLQVIWPNCITSLFLLLAGINATQCMVQSHVLVLWPTSLLSTVVHTLTFVTWQTSLKAPRKSAVLVS